MTFFSVAAQKEMEGLGVSRVRSYHLLVQVGRLFLLLALVGFFVVLVVSPLFLRAHSPRQPRPSKVVALDNRLQKAEYVSSHQGHAYILKANQAEYVGEDSVKLSGLTGTLKDGGRRDIDVSSQEGFYDRAQEQLFLKKDVRLKTTDGYVIEAPEVAVDPKTKRLSGTQGVVGEGPLGALKAEQFQINNDGEEVVLMGRSSLSITTK